MKYFSYIDHCHTFKNKLHKDVYEFLEKHNRSIIDGKEIEIFKQDILAGIADLNAANARCKPLKASWYFSKTLTGFNDGWLSLGGYVCTFCIYQSK